jgi:hypothetical protein
MRRARRGCPGRPAARGRRLGGSKSARQRAGGEHHDSRDPGGCRGAHPPHGRAAGGTEHIAHCHHAVDRIDEHVPGVVGFDEAKPPGRTGSEDRDAEAIAREQERSTRHRGGCGDARVAPPEHIGIETAEPKGSRIQKHRCPRPPPHGDPPRRGIEPWPCQEWRGDDVEQHDEKRNRKRLPKPVKPAADRHPRDRHEGDGAHGERQPARDRPGQGRRREPAERRKRHTPGHDRIPPGEFVHATGSRGCARIQASFIATCRIRRIFQV